VQWTEPGNVRELRNAIERAILLCDGGLITREHLPSGVTRGAAIPSHGVAVATNGGGSLAPENMKLDTMERGLVIEALGQTKGNKSKAARLLGLTRAQLYWRIEKYDLD